MKRIPLAKDAFEVLLQPLNGSPLTSTWALRVIIFETRKKMLNYVRPFAAERGLKMEEDYEGCFLGWLTVGPGTQSFDPNIGVIFLNEQKMGAPVVVHEIVHAATHILRAEILRGEMSLVGNWEYKLKNPDWCPHFTIDLDQDDNEEHLAHLISDLTHMLMKEFDQRKLGPWAKS